MTRRVFKAFREPGAGDEGYERLDASLRSLLQALLQVSPDDRITANRALESEWLRQDPECRSPSPRLVGQKLFGEQSA